MTREQLIEFLHEGLGICGCSDEDQAVGFVFDLLEVGEMRDAGNHEEASACLAEMMPEGDNIGRNLPIYWITAAGLTEHGYTVDQYGLSDLGNTVLEAIREHGADDELWEGVPDRHQAAGERTWN